MKRKRGKKLTVAKETLKRVTGATLTGVAQSGTRVGCVVLPPVNSVSCYDNCGGSQTCQFCSPVPPCNTVSITAGLKCAPCR
jgi:hypothetical protein